MGYQPGDIYYKLFVTNNISGVSTNTDSTPAGVLNKNGMDDFSASAKVYVSNIDLGRYNVSGNIPVSYQVGTSVSVTVSGAVNGLSTKAVFDLGVLDRPVSITGLPQVIMYSGGLDTIQIDGVNLRQALIFNSAVLAGISSGVGNTVWFDGINSNLARLSAIATSGIRTNINLIIP